MTVATGLRRVRRGAMLTLCGAAVATSGLAQQAAPPDEAPTQDIIVTATRRAEALRDVPASVSVLSADSLVQSGAQDLADYIYEVPGVSYARQQSVGRGAVTIRGLTTGGDFQPSVATYVDDVPTQASLGFSDGLTTFDQTVLDLDRVEVLKGPQGTLFGATAIGGVLRYITKQPVFGEVSGEAAAELSNTRNGDVSYLLNGVVNLPLTDAVALRVSGFRQEQTGYVDATGTAGGNALNGIEQEGGRIALAFKPDGQLTIRLSAQTRYAHNDDQDYVSYYRDGTPVANNLTRVDLRQREPSNVKQSVYSLSAEDDLGFATAYAIFGAVHQDFQQRADYTAAYSGVFGLPLQEATDERTSHLDKQTVELRLVSPKDGFLDWLGGFFFTNEDGGIAQTDPAVFPGGSPVVLVIGPDYGYRSNYREYAAYGSVDARPFDMQVFPLTITGGVRFAHYEEDILQINTGSFSAPPFETPQQSHDTPVTFNFALSYAVAPTTNAYLRVSSGYRPGGPNFGASVLSGGASVPSYTSDSVVNYEIGLKSTFLDRHADLEAAIYDIEWNDIQQNVLVGLTPVIRNAGSARITGGEVGANVRPLQGLELGFTAVYLDAKLLDGSQLLNAAPGARLPFSSPWSGSVNARYDFPLGDEATAFVSAAATFLGQRNTLYSKTITGFPSINNFVLPAFQQVDLVAGVEFGRVTATVFARNATDANGLLNAAYVPGDYFRVSPITPRTVGVRVATRF